MDSKSSQRVMGSSYWLHAVSYPTISINIFRRQGLGRTTTNCRTVNFYPSPTAALFTFPCVKVSISLHAWAVTSGTGSARVQGVHTHPRGPGGGLAWALQPWAKKPSGWSVTSGRWAAAAIRLQRWGWGWGLLRLPVGGGGESSVAPQNSPSCPEWVRPQFTYPPGVPAQGSPVRPPAGGPGLGPLIHLPTGGQRTWRAPGWRPPSASHRPPWRNCM